MRSMQSRLIQTGQIRQVDVWALGVCIFQWVFGRLPFGGNSTSEVFDAIGSDAAVVLPDGVPCSLPLTAVIIAVRG